jgi:hypothetical protein
MNRNLCSWRGALKGVAWIAAVGATPLALAAPASPLPAVVIGEAVVIGALDASALERETAAHTDALSACAARAPGSSAPRDVVVKYTVRGNGAVARAEIVSSALGDAGAEACLTDAFAAMRFPKPKGGGIVIVRVALSFLPG